MNLIKLTHLIDVIESGSRPKGGATKEGIPSIGGEHINRIGGFLFRNLKYIPLDFYQQMKNGKIHKNDILVVKDGATTGKVSFVDDSFPYENAAINEHVFRLEVNKNMVLPKFIFYYLYSPMGQNDILKDFRGATVGGISKTFTDLVEVLVPEMRIQEKVVSILDKAIQLINKRKEQIAFLDELNKSVFLDMFGDPISNPKGWRIDKLGKTGELSRGKSKHRPRNAPELLGGPYPLIQTGDIANSGLYINKYSQTYSELGLKQSRMWPSGTLCITIAANIAETGILTFDACFPDSVVAYIPKDFILNTYVQFWFMFLQKIIEDNAPESAQKNINLQILENLDLPVPPMELQQKFAVIVQKIELQKELLQRSLVELENNCNCLMQKAFNGDLLR